MTRGRSTYGLFKVSGNLLGAMVGPGKVSVGRAKGAKAQQKAALHALNEWVHGARDQRSARFVGDVEIEDQRREALTRNRARGSPSRRQKHAASTTPRTILLALTDVWHQAYTIRVHTLFGSVRDDDRVDHGGRV